MFMSSGAHHTYRGTQLCGERSVNINELLPGVDV